MRLFAPRISAPTVSVDPKARMISLLRASGSAGAVCLPFRAADASAASWGDSLSCGAVLGTRFLRASHLSFADSELWEAFSHDCAILPGETQADLPGLSLAALALPFTQRRLHLQTNSTHNVARKYEARGTGTIRARPASVGVAVAERRGNLLLYWGSFPKLWSVLGYLETL